MPEILWLLSEKSTQYSYPYNEFLKKNGYDVREEYWDERRPRWKSLLEVDAVVLPMPENRVNYRLYQTLAELYRSQTDVPLILLGEDSYLRSVVAPPSFMYVVSSALPPYDVAQHIFQIAWRRDLFPAVELELRDGRERNYWMLKINDSTWPIEQIKEDGLFYFNTFHHLGSKAEDYESFFQVRVGDLILLYAYDNLNAVIAVAEVTSAAYVDKKLGEIIRFKILRAINEIVKLPDFRRLISFAGSLTSATHEKLFSLHAEAFHFITSFNKRMDELPRYNTRSITQIHADLVSPDIQDSLGFTEDVHALASVIAYKELVPPLAIGLFGKWGSGKSYFMRKLEAGIEKLSQSGSGTYCDNIIAIHFNSWHYSDANLWASLVTRIFSELKRKGSKMAPAAATAIFEQLHSAKELKKMAEEEKQKVDASISQLQYNKLELEKKIREKALRLDDLSVTDVMQLVWSDPAVKADIQLLRTQYSFLHLDAVEDIERNCREVEAAGVNIWKGIGMVYSMRQGKAGLALLVALVAGLTAYLLAAKAAVAEHWLGDLKHYVFFAGVTVSQWMGFIRPGLKKVNDLSNRIYSLKRVIEEKQKQKLQEKNHELTELQKALDGEQAKQQELVKKIQVLEQESTRLETEIKDIASGKKLELFIENKVTDARYDGGLGIVSWIRKDFEELDRLLAEQRVMAARAKDLNQLVDKHFLIDRIVLYIDDLDRCSAGTVVKVLESIHLLLAFPLFIVVVGVDSRWMHHSLNKQYEGLLQKGNGDELATSKDYLEKIFQIPFMLKPMGQRGRDSLIRTQLARPAANVPEIPEHLQQQVSASDIEEVAVEPPGEVSGRSFISTRELYATNANTEEEQLLHITLEEVNFMSSISVIVGDSPRMLKRFINIYRVIRTHAHFQFVDGNELEHYFAAMTVLAVITGCPGEKEEFLTKIRRAQPHLRFGNLYHMFDHAEKAELELDAPDDNSPDPSAVLAAVKKGGGENIEVEKFKVNLELILRFSFG